VGSKHQHLNLLELRPERIYDWEKGTDGTVVVLVPKFRHPWMRWVQQYLRKKYFHVRLDAHGSFVWIYCDGKTPVGTIAEMFRKEFGDSDDVIDRLNTFLSILERDQFIRITV